MYQKLLQNLQDSLQGKKLIRLAHTLDEGLEQAILDVPQEIWYKYPTLGEDTLKNKLPCTRPFPNRDRDRQYTYDHLLWKMMALGNLDKEKIEPLFFCFKNSTNLDEVCEEFGFRKLMPDYKLFKDLQYKNRIHLYGVDENCGLIPFVETKIKETSYEELSSKLGPRFVIQFSFSHSGWNTSGGRDTYVIENKADFAEAQSDPREVPAKISKFIKGPSFAVMGIATDKGTFVSDYYLQLIGLPELSSSSTMYCGIDFTKHKKYSEAVREQIRKYTKQIGQKIYSKQYKGIFGVDFVLDEESQTVYVLEINPRFCGSTYMMNYLYSKAGVLPPAALHFAEHLDCIPETFQIEQYEQDAQNIQTGSFFYVRNLSAETYQLKNAPQPGIYTWKDGDIEFARDGHQVGELHTAEELLIRQIHPLQRNVGPITTICKVETLASVLDDEHQLKKPYPEIISAIYKKFETVPANTYDSSVPYDAH